MMNNDLYLLNFTYLTELAKSGEKAPRQLDDLNRFLVERNCTFRGEPMPTFLKPVFISPRQAELLHHTVDIICGALDKFTKLFLRNKEVRRVMNFTRQEEELFFIDPGYSVPLVIARLDAFMDGDNIKFLEFNCDSPAGIAYADIMEEGFRELFRNYPFLNDWDITYFHRQEILLQALLECYREFQAGHPGLPDRPTIAIVDWEDLATSSEFELLKTFFEEKGFPTVITSPQKITVTGERVMVEGNEIHLIYRRVITRELLEKLDEVGEYIQAIKGGYACACNPFQSYIVGNKKVLSLLTDPRFQDIYTDEEKNVIKRSIPWTRILADESAHYQGSPIKLRKFVSQNKDILVLKPANSYGGKDVHLGRETDREIWDNLIETRIASEEWVVQEYVPIPQEFFPTIGDKTTISLKKVNINPFAFRGEYAGTISRISESSIINVSAGGGLVPTMSVKRN
jgi:glutathionylspermidine synthase